MLHHFEIRACTHDAIPAGAQVEQRNLDTRKCFPLVAMQCRTGACPEHLQRHTRERAFKLRTQSLVCLRASQPGHQQGHGPTPRRRNLQQPQGHMLEPCRAGNEAGREYERPQPGRSLRRQHHTQGPGERFSDQHEVGCRQLRRQFPGKRRVVRAMRTLVSQHTNRKIGQFGAEASVKPSSTIQAGQQTERGPVHATFYQTRSSGTWYFGSAYGSSFAGASGSTFSATQGANADSASARTAALTSR